MLQYYYQFTNPYKYFDKDQEDVSIFFFYLVAQMEIALFISFCYLFIEKILRGKPNFHICQSTFRSQKCSGIHTSNKEKSTQIWAIHIQFLICKLGSPFNIFSKA